MSDKMIRMMYGLALLLFLGGAADVSMFIMQRYDDFQKGLSDELALTDGFLSIEQVRFGERLRVERAVDAAAVTCRVPPLLLQPLIENAITHGIARLLDGGVIRLNIERRDGRLSIVLENPRDPDEPARGRIGVGLDNVRRRLAATFPGAARMDASASPDRFRVEIDLPCVDHD